MTNRHIPTPSPAAAGHGGIVGAGVNYDLSKPACSRELACMGENRHSMAHLVAKNLKVRTPLSASPPPQTNTSLQLW
jgi:hypothetical protein